MTHRRTKIVCTIGPSVSSAEQIERLILAGMNVARLNFSHGTHEEHAAVISRLKEARQKLKVPLAIMLDTKGPEIRVGVLDKELPLAKGQNLTLVKSSPKNGQIIVTPPNVIDDLKVDMTVLFDDGYIIAKVVKTDSQGATLEILNDGVLKSRKGINIPHENVKLPAMTEQDIADITFGCERDIDYIAASFIRSADHVLEMKQLLHKLGRPDILIIAKIESAEGVKNFDAIVQVADGIMVARGDLGVEMPLEQVPVLQKMMIRKCYHLSKPVITATQMLESMIQHPRPTRAEVSDVANAIYDSTSAVMLSGETAVGKYPIETVQMMCSVIAAAEKDFNYLSHRQGHNEVYDVSRSVSQAVVDTAHRAGAKAIVAFTKSGRTPRSIACFRPRQPVIAVTSNAKCYHQLALTWGVIPVLEAVKNVTEGVDVASCFALKNKLARYGDLVVISSGTPFGISGTTDTLIIKNIGDVLVRGMAGKGQVAHGPVIQMLAPEKQRIEFAKGHIIVIPSCDDSYLPLLEVALGVILQNLSEDPQSERHLKALAIKLNLPYITRAENASFLLQDEEVVTIDPLQGLVFRGSITSDEEKLFKVCHTKTEKK